jgi:hypothetical protein
MNFKHYRDPAFGEANASYSVINFLSKSLFYFTGLMTFQIFTTYLIKRMQKLSLPTLPA